MPTTNPYPLNPNPSAAALPYNPALSLWLSVDPLSDKYPNLSPYVYCANNPVRLVDVDGREIDEWDLLRDGTLKLRENGRTDIDIVHATSDDGTAVSRVFAANSINQDSKTRVSTIFENTADEREINTDYMYFTNKNTAIDFFEFAAENTSVEWAVNISKKKSIVGTSHEESLNQVPAPSNVFLLIHSHWKENHILSDGCPTCDIPMLKNNPDKFMVYEAFRHSYVNYDKNTQTFQRILSRSQSAFIKQFIKYRQ